MTLTGTASAPSLSPDGTRLAFAEKQCDQTGYCTSQVVIQDTDGTGRLVLQRNFGYIYKTLWMSDGRLLEVSGSYPPTRHGSFAISTLGGEPRYLGPGMFDLVSGDTAWVSVGVTSGGDPSGWARRITVHDGQTLDSVPVRDPGPYYHVFALTLPDRLLVVARKTRQSPSELRLTDFRGKVIDRTTPGFGSLGRWAGIHWVPSRQKLVVVSQRELAVTEFDILTMDVTASRIGRDIDTVLLGLQMGGGIVDVSPDGERLIYAAGPVETSFSTIDIDRTAARRLAATQVLSSTALLRGRMSPAGDKILLVREIPRGVGHTSQFSVIPRNGGAEAQIAGASDVENLLDLKWSPDGARMMYLHGIGGGKLQLMERDTTGRTTREIARLEESAAVAFAPVPDGSVVIIPPDRQSISIIHRSGKRDATWRMPDWISIVSDVSPSPDAKSVAVEGLNQSGDSAVVAIVDIESGRFSRIATSAAQEPGRITWLEDGSVMFVIRETQGAPALYRIVPGRPAERLGALPYNRGDFSSSNDGRHGAAFGYSDKSDVYMIRNFGKMLRR
jgi:Tol biopolymer transport system component